MEDRQVDEMTSKDSEYTPRVVSLYAVARRGNTRAARFTYDPETGVHLDVFDPKGGGLATRYFETGAPFDRERRAVLAGEEPALFMRTLLQPANMSYYYFSDETATDHSG
jgi:hypothetical protein